MVFAEAHSFRAAIFTRAPSTPRGQTIGQRVQRRVRAFAFDRELLMIFRHNEFYRFSPKFLRAFGWLLGFSDNNPCLRSSAGWSNHDDGGQMCGPYGPYLLALVVPHDARNCCCPTRRCGCCCFCSFVFPMPVSGFNFYGLRN